MKKPQLDLDRMVDKLNLTDKSVNTENPKDVKKEVRKSVKIYKRKKGIDPNPEKGKRGDFLKVTITLSPEIFQLLNEESTRRRLEGQKPATVSGLIRESIVAHLS